eukprot:7388296-Prymnesium_polylepis.3
MTAHSCRLHNALLAARCRGSPRKSRWQPARHRLAAAAVGRASIQPSGSYTYSPDRPRRHVPFSRPVSSPAAQSRERGMAPARARRA